MNRQLSTILLSSILISAGWLSSSGFSIYNATETVTPSATPTMPWCEYTPTKRYQDVIPVIDFGATSTIDPLATETPTPAPTETIIPSQTPTGTWYGLSSNLGESRTLIKDGWTTYNTLTSSVVCGGTNKIAGIVWDLGKNWSNDKLYWQENINNTGWDGWYSRPFKRYFYIGINTTDAHNLVASYIGNSDYNYASWISDSYNQMRIQWYNYETAITGVQMIAICKQYDGYMTPTPDAALTATPGMTATPNCREYTDIYKDADPFAEFDYNYKGNTCVEIFDGIQLSLDDLPSVLLDAMDFLDTTGIFDISAVPELNVPGLEICLDQYEPVISFMDIDLVAPLSIMITLVVIGGLINEFRS